MAMTLLAGDPLLRELLEGISYEPELDSFHSVLFRRTELCHVLGFWDFAKVQMCEEWPSLQGGVVQTEQRIRCGWICKVLALKDGPPSSEEMVSLKDEQLASVHRQVVGCSLAYGWHQWLGSGTIALLANGYVMWQYRLPCDSQQRPCKPHGFWILTAEQLVVYFSRDGNINNASLFFLKRLSRGSPIWQTKHVGSANRWAVLTPIEVIKLENWDFNPLPPPEFWNELLSR